MAEEARRPTAELEPRDGELEAFALRVAHDLRQPLQVVGGFATLLGELYAGQLDTRADGYLEAMTRGVATMTAIVDGLVDFARSSPAELAPSVPDDPVP
jgi:light-regulated signal transduction histidine kinase (bacteriophytochrome)